MTIPRIIAAPLAIALLILATPAAITSSAATTERVSISSAGVQANAESSGAPDSRLDRQGATISTDGRFVAFHSKATNLDPADTDSFSDIFVRDRVLGTTRLISRAAGATGAKGNHHSFTPIVSTDGRHVAFDSGANNLHPDDTDYEQDVFVRDLQTDALTLVSRGNGGSGAKGNYSSFADDISPDGRYVSFNSWASNLDQADTSITRDVYVRDLQLNTTILASRETGPNGPGSNDESLWSSISADGRYIAFASLATNLSQDDLDYPFDIFVRDSVAHTTTLVSRGAGTNGIAGDSSSYEPELTDDGRLVAFWSAASNLHPDHAPFQTDVYVRDLETHANFLVSSGFGGAPADGMSYQASISPDGRFVAFTSLATNLRPGDSDPHFDAYARDLQTGITILVSRSSGCAKGNEHSVSYPAITSDAVVVFESEATNLVPGDTNGVIDAFVASGLQFVEPPAEDPCPEADNDGDGICDPLQTSESCSGSDAGKYEWLDETPGTADCRNIPEDFDSFHDGDGCPERDNDWDQFFDRSDGCPGTDATAGPDGVADSGDEPLASEGQPIRTREDPDGVLDFDGCYDAPGGDFDGDGFTDDIEALSIGTDPAASCGIDAWPPDIDDDGLITFGDIGLLTSIFGQQVPPAPTRRDIAPAPPDGLINFGDIGRISVLFGQSCIP